MLDTMTFTKAVGGLCGTLLIFLMGKWAAEELYHVGGGHGDQHAAAYVIDTGEDEAAEEEAPMDMAALLAAGDVAKGEKVFGKCRACHKLEDGANGTGPHLYGVIDREIGAIDGFNYSGALPAEAWTTENLFAFLESPKGWAPGTSMGFAGLKKPEDRANLIAYLATIGG